jgi:L-alanine-DL-glutamate epimerase-like enolase superfamily enzyme
MTRRTAGLMLAGAPLLIGRTKSNDIRITEIEPSYEEFTYRTPYMFGGREVDRVTLLNVRCTVRNAAGKVAHGFGSMPMGNMWAWPSKTLSYPQTLESMKAMASRITKLTLAYQEPGHPVDINTALLPQFVANAPDGMPKLCVLVTASPFDAAIHDAYGKLHGRNSFDLLGPDYLAGDLSRFLGSDFQGETLNRYVLPKPKPSLPMFHSVGASDPIFPEDIRHKLNDGLPQDLAAWIRQDGVTHIKIKLNGGDRDNDLQRVLWIDKAAAPALTGQLHYSLDFNEQCPNIDYLMGFLRDLKQQNATAFDHILYVEQPTARDLRDIPENDMHEAAKLRPVVIDESLTGADMLLLALKIGYSGIALKVCKCHSQELLLAALAQKRKMFLCAQDLTCPGAALVHSVELAARIPGVSGIEMNSREYVPSANAGWEKRFPGVFSIRDGSVRTGAITGNGLGVV